MNTSNTTPKKFPRAIAISLIGTILMSIGGPAQAVSLAEYFNNYGTTTNVNLTGLGSAGDGWAGGWINGTATDPNYYTGGLSYTADGYLNSGNEFDLDDGYVSTGGGNASNTTVRVFGTDSGTVVPLGGEIWISVLGAIRQNTGEAILWLRDNNTPTQNDNYIGIRPKSGEGPQGTLRYDNTSTYAGSNLTYNSTSDVVHLLLAKVEIDYEGTFDRISLWVDPNLSSGIDGLGAASLSAEGRDAFGVDVLGQSGIRGINLSFASTGRMDAIRISNDANAFEFVAGIPEPGSIAMLMGGAGMLAWYCRRARRV